MLPVAALAFIIAALVSSYLAYREWSEEGTTEGGWQARLKAMGRRVQVGDIAAQRRELQVRLSAAGVRDQDAVDFFLAVQLFTIAAVTALALAVAAFFTHAPEDALLVGVAGFAVGYLVPLRVLDARAEARRRAISKALPTAVDLLVSTIDAGLSVDLALARVSEAIGETEPALGEELGVTAREIDAGMPLEEAMRRLGRRVGLEELQALCSVIAQASVLGARIGQSLRDYAQASRRARIATLEERAGKLSARLTMPIVFCLLPACLLLMLAPAVVEAIRAFGDVR